MAKTDGHVKIGVELDRTGLESGLSGLGNFAKTGLKVVAGAVAGVTTAMGGAVAAATKVGSAFESEMSKVEAISGATGDDLDALTQKAKEMGETTMFSASESAQAMEYMAMAGWKTVDMLDGIEGIMNLAAASGEDLATTSDIVTDALTAFGMTAEDSTHFADVLAAASSNANTNVGLMGETFKYVAPVAGALGYTAEDTAVAIGLMANAGIKGSQAGTSLRQMMSRLAKPTDEVAVAMDALGVSLTKSDGSMKTLDEIMGDLRNGFDGLSEAESANLAASLAGQEAMSGLLAIVNASDEDFDKLKTSIYGCNGAAEDMAATMQNNLNGQITILKSAIEGLGIEIYDSIKEPLTDIVKVGTDLVGDLTEAFKTGGAAGLIDAGTQILSNLVVGITEKLPSVIDTAVDVVSSFTENLKEKIPDLISSGGLLIESLVSGVISIFPSLGNLAYEIAASLFNSLNENLPAMAQSGISMLLSFAEGIVSALPAIVDAGIQLLISLAQGVADSLPELIEKVPRIINSFADTVYSFLPKILAAGIKIIAILGKGIIESIPTIIENAGEIALAIFNVFSLLNLWSAGQKIISGLGNGAKSMIAFIKNTAKQIVGQLKHPFGAEGWSSIGKNIIQGIANGITGAIGVIKDAAKNAAKAAFRAAKDFLGIESPSKLMRDVIGKNMIAGIGVGMEMETPSLEKTSAQSASRAVQSMQNAAYERSEKAGAETLEEAPDGNEVADGRGTPDRPIHVHVEIDGREVARATAQYTDEQIAWEGL